MRADSFDSMITIAPRIILDNGHPREVKQREVESPPIEIEEAREVVDLESLFASIPDDHIPVAERPDIMTKLSEQGFSLVRILPLLIRSLMRQALLRDLIKDDSKLSLLCTELHVKIGHAYAIARQIRTVFE